MGYIKAGAVIAVSSLIAGWMGVGPANADGPSVNSECAGAELGRSVAASDGSPVVCIADDAGRLTWLPGGNAAKTIADLQAQGYTVTLDVVGDDPLPTCLVTQVHNAMTTTQTLGSGGTVPGGPGSFGNHHSTTIAVTRTIDVSLDCTGHG